MADEDGGVSTSTISDLVVATILRCLPRNRKFFLPKNAPSAIDDGGVLQLGSLSGVRCIGIIPSYERKNYSISILIFSESAFY
jgi:hypothetical protein